MKACISSNLIKRVGRRIDNRKPKKQNKFVCVWLKTGRSFAHHKRILPSACPVAMQSSVGWQARHVKVFLPPFLLSSLRKNLKDTPKWSICKAKRPSTSMDLMNHEQRLQRPSPVSLLLPEEEDLQLQRLSWSNKFTLCWRHLKSTKQQTKTWDPTLDGTTSLNLIVVFTSF